MTPAGVIAMALVLLVASRHVVGIDCMYCMCTWLRRYVLEYMCTRCMACQYMDGCTRAFGSAAGQVAPARPGCFGQCLIMTMLLRLY